MSAGNKYEHKINQVSYGMNLDQVLSDSDFQSNPERWNMMPGVHRYEHARIGEGVFRNVYCHGRCWFAWVCNRGGATAPMGTIMKWETETLTHANATGNTGRFRVATGSLVEGEKTHDILHVTDIAIGGGAAPESEWGIIKRTVVGTVNDDYYVQTPRSDQVLSAAPAVNDTAAILSRTAVIFASANDLNHQLAGVVVRQDGIADNYWGWVALLDPGCDFVAVLKKADTALTADLSIKVADDADGTAALSRVINGAGGDLVKGYLVGNCLSTSAADIASDLALCRLREIGTDEA